MLKPRSFHHDLKRSSKRIDSVLARDWAYLALPPFRTTLSQPMAFRSGSRNGLPTPVAPRRIRRSEVNGTSKALRSGRSCLSLARAVRIIPTTKSESLRSSGISFKLKT